jgi:hypothetical protein
VAIVASTFESRLHRAAVQLIVVTKVFHRVEGRSDLAMKRASGQPEDAD